MANSSSTGGTAPGGEPRRRARHDVPADVTASRAELEGLRDELRRKFAA